MVRGATSTAAEQKAAREASAVFRASGEWCWWDVAESEQNRTDWQNSLSSPLDSNQLIAHTFRGSELCSQSSNIFKRNHVYNVSLAFFGMFQTNCFPNRRSEIASWGSS